MLCDRIIWNHLTNLFHSKLVSRFCYRGDWIEKKADPGQQGDWENEKKSSNCCDIEKYSRKEIQTNNPNKNAILYNICQSEWLSFKQLWHNAHALVQTDSMHTFEKLRSGAVLTHGLGGFKGHIHRQLASKILVIFNNLIIWLSTSVWCGSF